jgi:hypothetical protein
MQKILPWMNQAYFELNTFTAYSWENIIFNTQDSPPFTFLRFSVSGVVNRRP